MAVLNALIGQSLILGQKSEQVIANNLANMETPGFHASRLSFRHALSQAVAAGSGAVAQVHGTVVTQPGRVQANGNNVSVTGQMVELAKSQLAYQTALAEWSHQQTEIKIAAEGRPL